METVSKRLIHGFYTNSNLPQHGRIIAEYVWIDGTGLKMRSKCRTLEGKITHIDELPEWNYDGSSTNQATTERSEVILKPVAFYPDPFRCGDNILVLCSTYRLVGENMNEKVPANTNFRHYVEEIFEKCKDFEPWFGMEQEYTLFQQITSFSKWPLGWPAGGFPIAEGPYYCSVGSTTCFGRVVMDRHYKACMAAKITVSGTNSENMPGAWEFQVGPCEGISVGDELWMARYLLWRITEDLNIGLSLHPKSIAHWSGAGLHTNYSTKQMRAENGYELILEAIEKLKNTHKEHIAVYGEDNHLRLHGKCETSHIEKFESGVGDRTASVRIPTDTFKGGKGYFEDRRPASNADPYVVGAAMCSTILLGGEGFDELFKRYADWIAEKATWEA